MKGLMAGKRHQGLLPYTAVQAHVPHVQHSRGSCESMQLHSRPRLYGSSTAVHKGSKSVIAPSAQTLRWYTRQCKRCCPQPRQSSSTQGSTSAIAQDTTTKKRYSGTHSL